MATPAALAIANKPLSEPCQMIRDVRDRLDAARNLCRPNLRHPKSVIIFAGLVLLTLQILYGSKLLWEKDNRYFVDTYEVKQFIQIPQTYQYTRGKAYRFSTNWFSYLIQTWSNYTFYLQTIHITMKCLEIGPYEGRSTLFIVENYCNSSRAETFVVDTWLGSPAMKPNLKKNIYDKFLWNLGTYIEEKKVIPLRGKSTEILPRLQDQILNYGKPKFDMIYIDGSHAARDVLSDMVISWSILNVGGLMLMDDYTWALFKEPELTPKPAIDGFLASFKGTYEILHMETQVHLRKLAD